MYRTHDEDRNAQSSESEPPEDGCESNDTNSGNPQEESQGRNENTAAPLHTRILGRILRNNQLLQIDQAQPTTGFDVMNDVRSRWRRNTVASPLGTERISLFRSPAPPFQRVRLSSSTTGLPDIGHGSSPSPQILSNTPLSITLEENDNDNTGPSLSESEVRRVRNTVFNRLEQNLAELIRMREEAIDFLDDVGFPNTNSSSHVELFSPSQQSEYLSEARERSGRDEVGEVPSARTRVPARSIPTSGVLFIYEPIVIRERLSFHTRRPFSNKRLGLSTIPRRLDKQREPFTMNKYSYTPTANFDNAPPGKPGKPHLEVGLVHCDEKAAAARKILEKLHFGDPEDEGTCFVRRFWRDTTTSNSGPLIPTLSTQLAGLMQRTASLEATLEEAFEGLRLRLQRRLPESSRSADEREEDQLAAADEGRVEMTGESGIPSSSTVPNTSNHNEHERHLTTRQPIRYYDAWNEETSVMTNPLHFDILDELEHSRDMGSSITAHIRATERRTTASMSGICRIYPTSPRSVACSGTEGPNENMEAQLLDTTEDEDEEDISTYFRYTAPSDPTRDRSVGGAYRSLSEESLSDFLQHLGTSGEDVDLDSFNMFSISESETRISSTPSLNVISGNSSSTMTNSDTANPLCSRTDRDCHLGSCRTLTEEENLAEGESTVLNFQLKGVPSTPVDNDDKYDIEEDDNEMGIPQIPLVDMIKLYSPHDTI